ncbi:thiamine pyrophosphate-binding protein [Bradyrhizobium sp. USDA 10063]
MSRTVAEALVDVFEKVGVKQILGLIGDSLNPLGDAVRQSKIDWVGSRFCRTEGPPGSWMITRLCRYGLQRW